VCVRESECVRVSMSDVRDLEREYVCVCDCKAVLSPPLPPSHSLTHLTLTLTHVTHTHTHTHTHTLSLDDCNGVSLFSACCYSSCCSDTTSESSVLTRHESFLALASELATKSKR
jgi:hypothetical protein